MSKTFQALCTYMAEHSANEFKHGRKSHHSIHDLLGKGQELMDSKGGAVTVADDSEVGLDCTCSSSD
jgi:hypothetical protein